MVQIADSLLNIVLCFSTCENAWQNDLQIWVWEAQACLQCCSGVGASSIVYNRVKIRFKKIEEEKKMRKCSTS